MAHGSSIETVLGSAWFSIQFNLSSLSSQPYKSFFPNNHKMSTCHTCSCRMSQLVVCMYNHYREKFFQENITRFSNTKISLCAFIFLIIKSLPFYLNYKFTNTKYQNTMNKRTYIIIPKQRFRQ